MHAHRKMVSRAALALMLAFVLFASSCSLYRNDRAWLPEEKYETAKNLYNQTGSLSLTQQTLREGGGWRRAEINEATYRLKKEFNLE